MKLLLTSLLALALLGCKPYHEGPDGPLDQKTRLISLQVYDSYEDLAKSPKAPTVTNGQTLKGFALFDIPVCQVHYVHNDYETLVHEIKHCYYGAWHD